MLVRPGLLVRAPLAAPSITGITPTYVSGTTISVEWTGNNMPFGVTYKLIWTISTPYTGGTGGGTINGAVSPQNAVADIYTGGTGSFTVEAYNGLTLIATANYTGIILT